MQAAPFSAVTGQMSAPSVQAVSTPLVIPSTTPFHQTRHSREIMPATRVLAGDATGNLSWDDENRRFCTSWGRFHCEGSTK